MEKRRRLVKTEKSEIDALIQRNAIKAREGVRYY
jgi:hypothetical protein